MIEVRECLAANTLSFLRGTGLLSNVGRLNYMNKRSLIFLIFSFVLGGCSATANLDAMEPGVSLSVNEKKKITLETHSSQAYATTSFGQYKFKAEKEGVEPMYGLIPLKFNSGYLFVDILFFAPALFFNLREVFPYYQFDLNKNEIRYKRKELDEWVIHHPTPSEIENAKRYFAE